MPVRGCRGREYSITERRAQVRRVARQDRRVERDGHRITSLSNFDFEVSPGSARVAVLNTSKHNAATEPGLIINEVLPDSPTDPTTSTYSLDTLTQPTSQDTQKEFTDLLHPEWLGTLEVGGLDKEALALRKAACRLWIARWPQS